MRGLCHILLFLWVVVGIILVVPCYGEDAIMVNWFPPALRQGEVLFVAVKPITEIINIEGDFEGTPIFFYKHEGGDFAGIIGVDMAATPGFHRLRVQVKDRTGFFIRAFQVEVQKGEFGVQRLTLAKEMVDLKGEVLKRVMDENRTIKEISQVIRRERSWHNPFALPVKGLVTGAFGLQRVINGKPRSAHSGVDIAALEGTPVESCNNGIVVLAQELYLSGKTVVIDHGFGLFSIYMHLSDIWVLEGKAVGTNEIIGLVGATGRASGPHLHWGVRLLGARIDPFSLLRLFPPKEFEEDEWEGF